jgi:hypothetical protein
MAQSFVSLSAVALSLATILGCSAVRAPPSLLPQWHAESPASPSRPPTCDVRVGSAREDVLSECGAPACRPRPESWVYPSSRFTSGEKIGYVVLVMKADVVDSITACTAANCCRL